MKKEMGLDHGGKPARHPFMHRTRSIDYALVLEGEIDMLLDDSEVHLKAGDVLIQLGTNHAWVNNSDKPCRIAFVLIDAKEPAGVEARRRRAGKRDSAQPAELNADSTKQRGTHDSVPNWRFLL